MLFPIDTIAAIMLLGLVSQALARNRLPVQPIWTSITLLLLSVLLCVSLSIAIRAAAERYLGRAGSNAVLHRRIIGLLDQMLRTLTVLLFGGLLLASGWPHGVLPAMGLAPSNYFAEQMVGIAPYILLCLASWIPIYSFHRRTLPGTWTLGAYLLYRIRYTMFVFGLWIPLVALLQVASGQRQESWVWWLTGSRAGLYPLLFLAAWVFPAFLRFFWGCSRLPDGPLRQRLTALQERAGVRFSQMYVWHFGGGLLNAAAVGLFPPFRYLFLSRALMESLPPGEVDSVVCHEMGHLRHRHLLFYVLFTLAVLSLAQYAVAWIGTDYLNVFTMIMVMILYFRFGFGFLSRRMERQADLFALEVQGSHDPLCRALDRIALYSGNLRHAASWHHLSIAERVNFLRAAGADPRLVRAHNDHVRQIKFFGYTFALLVFAILSLLPISIPSHSRSLPRSGAQTHTAHGVERHWQRVTRFLPQEACGPLGHADYLLKSGSAARKAAPVARMALARAATAAERRRARELLAAAERALRQPVPPERSDAP